MVDLEHMSAAGRAAAERAARRRAQAEDAAVRAGLRAEYDPYSDYMDMLARSSCEEPEADPWR